MKSVAFDYDLNAPVPWTCGAVSGNSEDRMWKTFEDHHGGRLQKDLYDDAVLKRTLWFDVPYIVLLDELDAETEKRLGFVFHCRGDMRVKPYMAKGGMALGLADLPEDGAWSFFKGRCKAEPVQLLAADWRVRSDVFLRAVTTCDHHAFEANWGYSPDNPAEISRGTVFLRTPGMKRRFVTVLELHEGTPSVAELTINAENNVEIRLFDGTCKTFNV